MSDCLSVCHILHNRLVCESVLQHLNINNVLTWREGLKMTKQIVGGVDYKVHASFITVIICFYSS